jgi:LuxR family maltose regulon positive regulatory protein
LQGGNFFLIPLDDRRQWYRYHHLFADVLRMHLMAEQPDQVPALHRRASGWYERNGFTADAIHHALAAKDFERAADLIEGAVSAMGQSRQESTLLGWLQALPDKLLQYRPVLSVHFVGALLQNGQLDGVEDRLRDAERWLDLPADAPERPIYANEEDFRRLSGLVAMYHAGISLVRGSVMDTMRYARQVLEFASEDDSFLRGAASALLGLALWTSGDLETAHRRYADGMAHLQKIGFISDAIGGSIALAVIRITQGRLRDAMKVYERGLQLATEKGTPGLSPHARGTGVRGTADMYVGMGELYREHNDLTTAVQHLQHSQELGEFAGFPQSPYRWRVAMARVRADQGDLDGALDLLHEAERLYVSDFYPNVRPVAAFKARMWIAQGRFGEAWDWARQQELSTEDELSYLREFEHITLARILLAQSEREGSDTRLRESIVLLERLLKAAEGGGRMGSAIEILVLQALAHQQQGDIPAALTTLERGLTLAEPENYMRLFLNEGEAMAQLLREAAACGILPDYTGRLLRSFETEQGGKAGKAPLPISPASKSFVEPLSQRELEILRLFKTELSGPEIARELVVALSTVRTHTKSIYSKLNVNSRRAAVRRAEELGLI